MGIAQGSREIESTSAAAGRVMLFNAAFAALARAPDESAHVSIVLLPPGREPT
jgi:hypothetical protein